jgi:hypothetical protein
MSVNAPAESFLPPSKASCPTSSPGQPRPEPGGRPRRVQGRSGYPPAPGCLNYQDHRRRTASSNRGSNADARAWADPNGLEHVCPWSSEGLNGLRPFGHRPSPTLNSGPRVRALEGRHPALGAPHLIAEIARLGRDRQRSAGARPEPHRVGARDRHRRCSDRRQHRPHVAARAREDASRRIVVNRIGSTGPHRRPLVRPIRQGDEFSSRRKSIPENARRS